MSEQTWERWELRGKDGALLILDHHARITFSEGTWGYHEVEPSPIMNWLKRVVDEAIEREGNPP